MSNNKLYSVENIDDMKLALTYIRLESTKLLNYKLQRNLSSAIEIIKLWARNYEDITPTQPHAQIAYRFLNKICNRSQEFVGKEYSPEIDAAIYRIHTVARYQYLVLPTFEIPDEIYREIFHD